MYTPIEIVRDRQDSLRREADHHRVANRLSKSQTSKEPRLPRGARIGRRRRAVALVK